VFSGVSVRGLRCPDYGDKLKARYARRFSGFFAALTSARGSQPHTTGSAGADHDLSALFAEPEAADRSPRRLPR
jgi:hypothetical protein